MAGSQWESDVERFLDNLPPSTNKYTYKGKEQFDQILQNEKHRLHKLPPRQPLGSEISDYFVIFIDPSTFEQDFLLSDLLAGTSLFYNAALHALILRMSTPEHAQVSYGLQTEFTKILLPMGLCDAVEGFGNVNVNVGDGNVKRPDWGWGPLRPPRGAPRRPGVVLEVGVSETETKLRDDASMWVDPLRGQVKTAITIKVNRKKPELKLDKWEWDAGAQRPRVTQSCVIGKAPNNVTVSQHPITIPFDHIFGRAPEIPREADIRLGKESLANMARYVWSTQGL
ncbi:hypothetical protein DTO006G1_2808 [Penicillium roqueforti]|uniref:uncharacterized protein n=1 Tax=Penicillium roqueforti TaxID=5082 RepID=UPI00190B3BBE|nr:uncharacterized protein LCP9604111_2057 [Penicillium roqueforti]KAF9252061.1 hypothetical protein LCP9604111_2057 [Penicillium roqueforti]KAI1837330.1 hypothetical protein CBS147337_1613 [Penicillium roqueforti]KAI2702401.1 hypothetical protein CBS147372_4134 [Penicillium roqueforti]KAI2721516.1 hypothetical protein CBS147318_2131 [Penicillium roqueforti]KAI2762050.1 hypothetical protein DTO006G1_2808 [Penicillium roqueforti]